MGESMFIDDACDANLPTPSSNDTVIQLKLHKAPINFYKRRYKDRHVWYKISTTDIHQEAMMEYHDGQESSSWQDMQQDWSSVKISVLKEGQCTPEPQEQFGHLYDENEFILFQTSPLDAEQVMFVVNFYIERPSPVNGNGEAGTPSVPEFIGHCTILHSNLRGTSGSCTVPITGTRNLPIGQLSAEFLMIRPLLGVDHGDKNLSRSWKPDRKGLDVGHRGAGSRRRTETVTKFLENTVASFNYAAHSGADMVELDVQLTKDLIPVIYHDYYVNIAMKKKRSREDHEFLQIPIKDLSIEQLHLLKSSPVHPKSCQGDYDFLEDDHQDNQPFPTLEHILQVVESSCGFNVEIKYPMLRQDGTYDGAWDKMCDLNEYVDTILRVLFNHAQNRNIIISCFHPDICALVALKQTRYPTLFLTQGRTEKWPAYSDPRTHDVQMAAFTALSMRFAGINAHAEDLLKDRSLISFVKSLNLILFVWGDDLNDKSVINQLKVDGVDGVVCDRVDVFASRGPFVLAHTSGTSNDKKVLMNIITSTGHGDLLNGSSTLSCASSGVTSSVSDVSP